MFAGFCELLGVRLKSAKSEVGPEVTFLGLVGTYPAKKTDFVLQTLLPGGGKKARSALIPPYLTRGGGFPIKSWRSCWGGWRSRELFLSPSSPGHRYAPYIRSCIGGSTTRPLWMKRGMRLLGGAKRSSLSPPRVFRPLARKFDWLLYADAATNPPCICALLLDPWKAGPSLDTQTGGFRSALGTAVQADVSDIRIGAFSPGCFRGRSRTTAGRPVNLDLHGQ